MEFHAKMAHTQRHKPDGQYKFLSECQNNVKAIEKYMGSDPLALWYEYLLWIEEHFMIDFKQETIFDLILSACLSTFEQDERYKQDRRLIKLFIKFVSQSNTIFGVQPKFICNHLLSRSISKMSKICTTK